MSVDTNFKTSGNLAPQPTRTQTKIPPATCREPAINPVIGSYSSNYTTGFYLPEISDIPDPAWQPITAGQQQRIKAGLPELTKLHENTIASLESGQLDQACVFTCLYIAALQAALERGQS